MSDRTESEKPRQKRAEITREKICNAAIRLLGRGGGNAVTHRAVADLAGVSLASTTYHFKDKEELLRRSFEWLIEHYSTHTRQQLEVHLESDLTPEGLARFVVSVSRQSLREEDEREVVSAWYAFMLEASRNPALQETAEQWYQATYDYYERILERFNTRNKVEDIRRLVDFLIGYEFSMLALHRHAVGEKDIASVYTQLIRSMIDGE